jgi:hypothetical protein
VTGAWAAARPGKIRTANNSMTTILRFMFVSSLLNAKPRIKVSTFRAAAGLM